MHLGPSYKMQNQMAQTARLCSQAQWSICLSPAEKKNKVIFIQNDQNPSLCLRPYSEH